jgi:hypothetical protein
MKLTIDVRWDGEASVWYAISRGKSGLATESETLDGLRERILAVLPDLLGTELAADAQVELVVHGISTSESRVAAE